MHDDDICSVYAIFGHCCQLYVFTQFMALLKFSRLCIFHRLKEQHRERKSERISTSIVYLIDYLGRCNRQRRTE
jgi:hypothetical protein